jgi:translation initiation factor 4G
MLKNEMPTFPNPKGGKDITFKKLLLEVCQAEFENIPSTRQPTEEQLKLDPEELNFEMKRLKGRFLANMKFIGNLFLQHLLTCKIINGIMQDLLGSSASPEDMCLRNM